MAEKVVKVAWLLLALVHLIPTAVLFAPDLAMRLYDVAPAGPTGVLIIHRGALFLAVMVAALWAMIDPTARRISSLTVGISIIGFLAVYARAGLPDGPLRIIAMVDAVALLPLALVTRQAWRRPAFIVP